MKKLIALVMIICLVTSLTGAFATEVTPVADTTQQNTQPGVDTITTDAQSVVVTTGETTQSASETGDGSAQVVVAGTTDTVTQPADGTIQPVVASTDTAVTTNADGALILPGADSGTPAATNPSVGITTVTTSTGSDTTTVTNNNGNTNSGTTAPLSNAASGSAIATSGNSAYPAEGKTRTKNVILRKSPDAKSKQVKKFSKKGQELTVNGEEIVDGVLWYSVTSPKGSEGYIQGIYLSVEESDRITAIKKSGTAKKMEVTVEATCDNYQGLSKTWSKVFEINGAELVAQKNQAITVELAPDVEFSYLTCLIESKNNASGIGKETYTPTAGDITNGFTRTQSLTAVSKKGKQIIWNITFSFMPEGTKAAAAAAAKAEKQQATTVKKASSSGSKKTTTTTSNKKQVVMYNLEASADKPTDAVTRKIHHYEEREMQVTERVQTGTKKYYVYETDEKGKSVLTQKEKPVYSTQTVTKMVSVPVYEDELPAGYVEPASTSTNTTTTNASTATAATTTTTTTAADTVGNDLEEETMTETVDETPAVTTNVAASTVETAVQTDDTAITIPATATETATTQAVTTAATETAATQTVTTADTTVDTTTAAATEAISTVPAAVTTTTASTPETAPVSAATTATTTTETIPVAASTTAVGGMTKDDIVKQFKLIYFGPVSNDTTGNLRSSQYFSTDTQEKFAADYYRAYFENSNEIHALINPLTQTTAKISVVGNQLLVVIYSYVNGEESNAASLFTGNTVGAYMIDLQTGEVTNMTPVG